MSTFKVSFMFMMFNLIFYTLIKIIDAAIGMNWLFEEDNLDWLWLFALTLFAILYPIFSRIFTAMIKYLDSKFKKEDSNETNKPGN